jgi:hypothetical protein
MHNVEFDPRLTWVHIWFAFAVLPIVTSVMAM